MMNKENLQSNPLAPSAAPLSVPWGWREMIAAILFTAFGIIVLNLAVVGIGLAFRLPLQENKDAMAFFLAVQDVVVVGAAWLFGLKRFHVGWHQVGIRPFSIPIGCGLALILLILSYVVRFVYGIIAIAFGLEIEQQEVLSRLDMEGLGFVVTLVAAGLIAPVAEEIFFRGFLYGGMRRRIGVVGGMVVSTLLFTALHLSLPLFIPIFVLGLFLAWLYEYTGSLYPGIFLHAANNTVSLILLFVLQRMGVVPLQ